MKKVSEIKPEFYERAARLFCQKVNLDPDARSMEGAAPNWKKHALEIRRLMTLVEAMDEVDDQIEAEEEAAKWSPWVTWEGGDCPIADGQETEVRFGDDEGSTASADTPSAMFWGSSAPLQARIVAYRVRWIPWEGLHGEQPPADDVMVCAKTRHGVTVQAEALAFTWAASVDCPPDVVGYYVLA